jgi:hypothetical protein
VGAAGPDQWLPGAGAKPGRRAMLLEPFTNGGRKRRVSAKEKKQ